MDLISQIYQVDFWQHIYLATIASVIIGNLVRLNIQKVFIYTLLLALLWEASELLYNMDAYASTKAFLLDSVMDMTAALVALIVLWIIVPLVIKFTEYVKEKFNG